jgi:hypothetical protein
MRSLASAESIRRFMEAVGRDAKRDTRIYFAGGVSAVLMGWRESTIDIDLSIQPDDDEVLRLFPALKDQLQINVELASPAHFVPELPGWQERSVFVAQHGSVTFLHYDFYTQALSKIERGHDQDLRDVGQMMDHGLVEPDRLRTLFEAVIPELYRYPAIDPESLRRAVDEVVRRRRAQP